MLASVPAAKRVSNRTPLQGERSLMSAYTVLIISRIITEPSPCDLFVAYSGENRRHGYKTSMKQSDQF